VPGQAGACPTKCQDYDACTSDALLSAGTCGATCSFAKVTACKNGDGCCPAGCNGPTDDDCPACNPEGVVATFDTSQSTDLTGQIIYFDNANSLPKGHYRITYIDGCMRYSAGQDWAVNAYTDGSAGFWLVGATSSDRFVMPPGTFGVQGSPLVQGKGGFTNFDACVLANLALPPAEFDFPGGKIGVWLNDTHYGDNVNGPNGRNPKWQLTLLNDCSAAP
jgi:hypothetical protein